MGSVGGLLQGRGLGFVSPPSDTGTVRDHSLATRTLFLPPPPQKELLLWGRGHRSDPQIKSSQAIEKWG